jgi:hypothetical protein
MSARLRAIERERDRRVWKAYFANDQLTAGRLWHNRSTGTPEDEVTDDQAMNAYREMAAFVEEIQSQF